MFNLTLIIAAIATAMVYVLSSYGLIVTYRVAGVFNFAFGYQAALSAFFFWQMTSEWHVNVVVAALVDVFGLAPVVGAVVQRVLFSRRREVLSSLIITLGLGVFLDGLITLLWGKYIGAETVSSVFGSAYWRFLGSAVTASEVGTIACAVVVGVGVYLLINHSQTGMRMRAVVDSPELASATGIPYGRMSGAAWVIGSVLAAISGVLLAPLVNLDVGLLSELVVDAFAIVAFAGMVSLPMVVIGSVLLAYVQELADRYPNVIPFSLVGTGASESLPFIMLAIVLLVHPAVRRTVRVVGGGLQRQLRARASGNVSTAIAIVVVLTVVAELLNASWSFNGEQVACYAIAALSLVLLVGASGQISLCQVTFMGGGAVIMGKLTAIGWPWGLALLGGVLASALAGLIVALTAFRLRGLFLALITYAFAYAALVLVFQNQNVISFAGLSVNRPAFFGVNLNNDRSFLIFTDVFLVLVILAVGAVLRGPWGRALQTLSAGDAVASVSGISVRVWKMLVFAVSAGLAGLAGGLAATSNITITGSSFSPDQSVALLVFALVGGITTPTGAVVAGVIAGAGSPILGTFISNPGGWALVLFGVMAMDTTIRYPAGLGGLLPSTLPGLPRLAGRLGRARARRPAGVEPTAISGSGAA